MDEDDSEDDYVRPRLYSLKKEFAIKFKSQSRESRIQHTSTPSKSKVVKSKKLKRKNLIKF